MPIYAYKCGSCGHAQDVLQKISDAPPTACPVCGAAEFTKQVTAAGFQLKGSGWYATDFRGGSKNGAKNDEGAKPADGPAKPADGGAKPADGAAKTADSTAKTAEGGPTPPAKSSDAPKASAGGCGCH